MTAGNKEEVFVAFKEENIKLLKANSKLKRYTQVLEEEIKAICCFTQSGTTALLTSRERPRVPIIGLTVLPATARRLNPEGVGNLMRFEKLAQPNFSARRPPMICVVMYP